MCEALLEPKKLIQGVFGQKRLATFLNMKFLNACSGCIVLIVVLVQVVGGCGVVCVVWGVCVCVACGIVCGVGCCVVCCVPCSVLRCVVLLSGACVLCVFVWRDVLCRVCVCGLVSCVACHV